MDLFQGNVVDGGFRAADDLEDLPGNGLGPVRDVGRVDQLMDVTQVPVRMVMVVRMPVPVPVTVSVSMLMMVVVIVAVFVMMVIMMMIVAVFVLVVMMMVMVMIVTVFVPCLRFGQVNDLDVPADDPILIHFPDLYLAVGQIQCLWELYDLLIAVGQGAQGAEKHISGQAREGFDV